MRFVGVDLAGSPKRPTGWALLDGRTIMVKELYTDNEILTETVQACPTLVAIDAPLTMPREGALRRADREMRRLGYPVLPPLLPGMKMLTHRAMRLVGNLRKFGVEVIEIHPTSARRALGMPLKDWDEIQRVFLKLGFCGGWSGRRLSPHEIDAITAAIVALLHVCGETQNVGDPSEGVIVLPTSRSWRDIPGR